MNSYIAKMPDTGKVDETNEFNLPKIVCHFHSYKYLLQPEEEILKFTLQEDLTEVERIKQLLSKKNPT